jgi:hypothetical protein
MCVYCHLLEKKFGFLELLFVIFLYLLTVLNTLSTVIDDIPSGSRKRQNFQDIKIFQKLSTKKF